MVFTALTQHTLEENLKAIKERCFITMCVWGGTNKQTQSTKPRHTHAYSELKIQST